MSPAVPEPLQNVIHQIPMPSLHMPSLHSVVERLPDRLRPEPARRSRRPLVVGVLLFAAIMAVMLMRRRGSAADESRAFDGASMPAAGDASLVQVR